MKKFKLYLFIGIVIVILASCESDLSNQDELELCRLKSVGYINYELEIDGRWTESNFGSSRTPGNAHFSPIVVFAHKSDAHIFKTGREASSKLEKLAEDGKTDITSIHDDRDDIGCVVVGKVMDGGDSQKIKIPVNNIYNSITILSMIAPTPDWFVAKRIELSKSDNIFENSILPAIHSTFKNNGSEDFRNYDAGTEQDNGNSVFTIKNDPESPHKAISRIDGATFSASDVLIKVKYKQVF